MLPGAYRAESHYGWFSYPHKGAHRQRRGGIIALRPEVLWAGRIYPESVISDPIAAQTNPTIALTR